MQEEVQDDDAQKVYKIIVVGDMGTGKTSMIRRFVEGNFSEFYKITIGVDFANKIITADGVKCDIQLWDIAGQERFGSMTGVYYRESVGAIVVFDITRPSTFEMTKIWMDDIQAKVQTSAGEAVPTLLIGNKIDLKPENWGNKTEEMQKYAEENHYLQYFETSAKDGTNLEEAIQALASYIVKNNIEPESTRDLKGVDISETSKVQKTGCC
ncbi:Ras family protein [Trichomonas vaginalis G3]|uniref:Ras-related protein Rab n=2 Tax=Trichomonas vaginalis TaxID=5722 RepID=A0A8U0WPV3_TRIV3|nr:small Rab GTPase RabX11 [Trichomonas vaginalis G3]AAX97488.1 small Rab GTPase RabX11 [Trichomonas vaginalis]EAY10770.1 Ras family protein [Trichomonas vaginalis G3]KAI5536092.1 small Rab GTPase RabX11 [Trichomonas vaginalis G3]|eukprot:XP_001322993.1 Ras family protein [Trichomonas vaginalis G3]